ncbi:MAG: hypothetical protein KKB50_11415 [Planctomycetes bacterium]|nr:hypothetical protein [Planctomycetota bacterium]
MTLRLRVLAITTALILTAVTAWADAPPPVRSDPISITRGSPSIAFGNTPGEIYGENPLGVFWGAGWDVGGPGPILHVAEWAYGITPLAPGDNNDAHSNGERRPDARQFIFFSGDKASQGVPLTAYRNQFLRNQAAGDRFVTNGATWTSPAAVIATGAPTAIAPAFPGPLNILSANQTRFNEIPSIPPPVFNGTWTPDDMDAVELTLMDLNGDNVHETDIYFSLDPTSPSLGGGFFPADLLFSPAGSGAFLPYAPAVMMGLDMFGPGTDDIDAVAVWDSAGIGIADPGMDYAIFSLAPGSMYLAGPDGIWGTGDDLSPADIFVTDFNGFSMLFLPAAAIGMLPTDNVDALDVEFFVQDPRPQVFDWWVQLSNFDVWLPPWVPPPGANDFDLILWGITPEQLSEFWTGSFPDVTVTDIGGGTEIVWTGGEVPPGANAHFGVVINDDTKPEDVEMYWTWDGVRIFDIPRLWQWWDWVFDGSQTMVVDIIENRSPEPAWIMRRINTSNTPINLGDLMVGGRLWNSAVAVDPAPLLLMPGEVATFDFPFENTIRGYAMMYDVMEDAGGIPGEPRVTFLNAVSTIEFAGLLGDLNCDGVVNGFDIDGFILALNSTAPDYPEYYDQFPNCNIFLADCNQDGAVNGFDIDSFILILGG